MGAGAWGRHNRLYASAFETAPSRSRNGRRATASAHLLFQKDDLPLVVDDFGGIEQLVQSNSRQLKHLRVHTLHELWIHIAVLRRHWHELLEALLERALLHERSNGMATGCDNKSWRSVLQKRQRCRSVRHGGAHAHA